MDWVPTFGGNFLGWVPTWVLIVTVVELVLAIVALAVALRVHIDENGLGDENHPPLL
jgi:hypothetical protein